MICKVTLRTGHILTNTRPHQLRWGDQEMETAISYTKCSQVADLIQKRLVEAAQNHCLFVQLSLFEDPSVRIIAVRCRCAETCVLKRWGGIEIADISKYE